MNNIQDYSLKVGIYQSNNMKSIGPSYLKIKCENKEYQTDTLDGIPSVLNLEYIFHNFTLYSWIQISLNQKKKKFGIKTVDRTIAELSFNLSKLKEVNEFGEWMNFINLASDNNFSIYVYTFTNKFMPTTNQSSLQSDTAINHSNSFDTNHHKTHKGRMNNSKLPYNRWSLESSNFVNNTKTDINTSAISNFTDHQVKFQNVNNNGYIKKEFVNDDNLNNESSKCDINLNSQKQSKTITNITSNKTLETNLIFFDNDSSLKLNTDNNKPIKFSKNKISNVNYITDNLEIMDNKVIIEHKHDNKQVKSQEKLNNQSIFPTNSDDIFDPFQTDSSVTSFFESPTKAIINNSNDNPFESTIDDFQEKNMNLWDSKLNDIFISTNEIKENSGTNLQNAFSTVEEDTVSTTSPTSTLTSSSSFYKNNNKSTNIEKNSIETVINKNDSFNLMNTDISYDVKNKDINNSFQNSSKINNNLNSNASYKLYPSYIPLNDLRNFKTTNPDPFEELFSEILQSNKDLSN